MISSLGSQQGMAATQWRQAQFQKADANADNALSRDELLASLKESPMAAGGEDMSAVADKVLKRQDTDGNGSLSSSEFSAAPPRFDRGSNAVLLQAQEQTQPASGTDPLFARTDADGNGSLTRTELTDAFGGADAAGASDLADEVMAAMDGDDDGAISTAEFADARAKEAELRGPPPGGPPPGGPGGGIFSSSSTEDDDDSDSTTAAAGSSSQSLAALLGSLDADGDGSLNLEEFSAMFSGGGSSGGQAGFGARLSSGTLGFLLQGNQAA